MQVDATEARRFVQKSQPVIDENLCDRIAILRFLGQIEAGHHARVLVKARPFRQSAQRAFNRAYLRFKPLIGHAFLVDTGERKEATVPFCGQLNCTKGRI